jgi:CBS domain-containing protein
VRCPYCSAENLPGVDLCQGCGADLAGLDLPEAAAGFAGRLMTDRLGRVPRQPPLPVGRDTTVAEAVVEMRRRRHGCVLVEDGGRLAGIFTERDLLVRVVRRGLDPAATPLAEVMTPDPITLAPDDPPAFAIHRMVVGGLRHLPIVEGERLLGFVTVRDVLRYIARDVLGGEAA